MMSNTMSVVAQGTGNDSELVARCLAGDRTAFGEIVARYQSLICSLAYSATGSLTQSEDLAQETFLTAWKQLAALREPAKLRSWLCGIARNQINAAFRKQGREPVSHATQLESVDEPSTQQKAPVEEAISKEEEAILWRSLEAVPQQYREPLILFYREGQSVERVAAALEISEDAAKQRLSRGRKLLQDQVTAFVEGALVRSVPGKAFTLGVLAALPASMTLSANAASMAAGAAKGSSAAKAAAATGIVGAILTPVMGIFGTWVSYRLGVDSAKSDLERDFVKRMYKRAGKVWVALTIPMLAILICSDMIAAKHPVLLTILLCGIVLVWIAAFTWLILDQRIDRRRLIEMLERNGLRETTKPIREYRSKASFLGLPLIHYRIGGSMAARGGTVRAWIALGDSAIGGLFAFGGVAIAPICCGGFGVGLISFSGCSIGLLALGGMAIGPWAFGAVGVGWFSFSAFAIAWKAAAGGAALAREFACGGFAQALDANNDAARDFILSQGFFRVGFRMLNWLPWLNLVWLVPLLKWWRVAKKGNQPIRA
jgi:RNA polymerase sigma factor (sigma-70 family)